VLWEAKLKKNSSALLTTETRSTRRCTENPDASVKSPCPLCLRGERGRLAACQGDPILAPNPYNNGEVVGPLHTQGARLESLQAPDSKMTNDQ